MYTAPSPPARAPGYLLPEAAHGLLRDVGDVLQRLAALAATEQATDDRTAHLLCLPGVLTHCLHNLSARIDVALRQCNCLAQPAHDQRRAP